MKYLSTNEQNPCVTVGTCLVSRTTARMEDWINLLPFLHCTAGCTRQRCSTSARFHCTVSLLLMLMIIFEFGTIIILFIAPTSTVLDWGNGGGHSELGNTSIAIATRNIAGHVCILYWLLYYKFKYSVGLHCPLFHRESDFGCTFYLEKPATNTKVSLVSDRIINYFHKVTLG